MSGTVCHKFEDWLSFFQLSWSSSAIRAWRLTICHATTETVCLNTVWGFKWQSFTGAAARIDNAAALLYLPVWAKLRRLAGWVAGKVCATSGFVNTGGRFFRDFFFFLPSNRGWDYFSPPAAVCCLLDWGCDNREAINEQTDLQELGVG